MPINRLIDPTRAVKRFRSTQNKEDTLMCYQFLMMTRKHRRGQLQPARAQGVLVCVSTVVDVNLVHQWKVAVVERRLSDVYSQALQAWHNTSRLPNAGECHTTAGTRLAVTLSFNARQRAELAGSRSPPATGTHTAKVVPQHYDTYTPEVRIPRRQQLICLKSSFSRGICRQQPSREMKTCVSYRAPVQDAPF